MARVLAKLHRVTVLTYHNKKELTSLCELQTRLKCALCKITYMREYVSHALDFKSKTFSTLVERVIPKQFINPADQPQLQET